MGFVNYNENHLKETRKRQNLDECKRNIRHTHRKSYMKLARHAPQYGCVDVIGPVGGAHDEDLTAAVGDEAVPEDHELRLDHHRRLVVLARPRPEQRVCAQETDRQPITAPHL